MVRRVSRKGALLFCLISFRNAPPMHMGYMLAVLMEIFRKAVFFRCIFNWYRTMRLIDIMAVGGSGGHFSPEYFDYVRIPKFPDDKQVEIALLYHQDGPSSPDKPSLDTFVDWHRRWNASLGIWELDREMKALQHTLSEVQEQIIEGKNVIVPN